MPTPSWIRVVIGIAAVVGVVTALATTGKVDFDIARAIWTTNGAVVLVVLVYDRWAWRWRPLHRLTRRPDLQGTWKGELRSSWPGRANEIIECYIAIRQTYSAVSVDMLFEGSSSRWISGDLIFEEGRCVLYYVFRTEARALHRDGNAPARGGAALIVAREPSLHLDGDYWTERETRGTVRSINRTPRLYETFEAAKAAEYV